MPPATRHCKDSNRRGSHEHTSFTFLGFTFRPRQARRKDGGQFTSFLPAISKDALKKISAEVRSWRLHRWVTGDRAGNSPVRQPEDTGLDDLLRGVLPLGAVSPVPPHQYLPAAVVHEEVQEAAVLEESHPGHGRSGRETAAVLRALGLGETGSPEDQDDKSRITGDCYARICGSPGVRLPRATRPLQEHLGFTFCDFTTVRSAVQERYSRILTGLRDETGDIVMRCRADGRDPTEEETRAFRKSMSALMFLPGERASFTVSDIADESALEPARVATVLDAFSIGFDDARDTAATVASLLRGLNPLTRTCLARDTAGNYLMVGYCAW